MSHWLTKSMVYSRRTMHSNHEVLRVNMLLAVRTLIDNSYSINITGVPNTDFRLEEKKTNSILASSNTYT